MFLNNQMTHVLGLWDSNRKQEVGCELTCEAIGHLSNSTKNYLDINVYLHPSRMVITFKNKREIISIGKNVEKLETSYIAGGIIKCCCC